MRKSFLLGGVVLLAAAVSMAGQRTRGSERPLGGDAAKPVVNFTEVEPGVAVVTTVHGLTAKVRADGSVWYEEIMTEFGSPQRAGVELTMTGQPNRKGGDGQLMFADGSVPYFADIVGDNGPDIFSVDKHMQQVRWAESPETGEILFADGVVTVETSPKVQTVSRSGIPGAPNGPGLMYVDGVVITE